MSTSTPDYKEINEAKLKRIETKYGKYDGDFGEENAKVTEIKPLIDAVTEKINNYTSTQTEIDAAFTTIESKFKELPTREDDEFGVMLKAGGCPLSQLIEDSFISRFEFVKSYEVTLSGEIDITVENNGYVQYGDTDKTLVNLMKYYESGTGTVVLSQLSSGITEYEHIQPVSNQIRTKADYTRVFNVVDISGVPTKQLATIEVPFEGFFYT